MQSNSLYGKTSDECCSIFLVTGGVSEGQAVSNGTCDPGMAFCSSTESCSVSFLDISKNSEGKRCMRGHQNRGNDHTEDDLNLVLGLGSTPGSLNYEANSGSEFSLAQEGTGKKSTCDSLTSSRGIVSSVMSRLGDSLDSVSEGYPDGSHESKVDNRSFSLHERQQSSSWVLGYRETAGKGSSLLMTISRESTSEMDLQPGLSTYSSLIMLDCLSGMPSTRHSVYPQDESMAAEQYPLIDEGSTSARWMKSGGYNTALSPYIDARVNKSATSRLTIVSPEDTTEMDVFMKKALIVSDTASESFTGFSGRALKNGPAVSSAGSMVNNSERISKVCSFKGCPKVARGASGLCIGHGGGRRCHRPHCNKGAEGCTVYCKAHGGGRRCESLGCIRSAEGRTNFCIGHGGGHRCNHDGCNRAARGKSGFCIRHGGGKRCQKEGCTKSAEGFSGLCISHGGGRRCQYPGCGKGSQGSTMFCKAHGGGRRCEFEGCTKGAEGSTPFCKGHGGGKRCMFGGGTCTKSVHGATLFCVAHGGGKRCASEGCLKSARGSTDYCVRHGGGKRCKFKDCSKSAQGSTDFCKAHGGGRKCSWCQEGSTYNGNILVDKVENDFPGPCNRFARGKFGFCAEHGTLVQQLKGRSGYSYSNSTMSDRVPGPGRTSNPNVQYIQAHFNASEHSCHFGPIIDYDKQLSSDISEAQLCQYACTSGLGSDTSTAFAQVGPPWCGFPLSQPSLQSQSLCAVNMNDSRAAEATFLDVPHSCEIPGKSVRLPEKVSSFFLSELMFPSSTQKGDPPMGDKIPCVGLTDSNLASDDISKMFSLSVPDERVHGGGLMALLANEAARHVESQ